MLKRISIYVLLLLAVIQVQHLALAEMNLKQVDKVLQDDPNNIPALFQKARLLEQQNRIDEAIVVYQQIIRLAPQLPEPYNNLAALYVKQGKLEEARKVLEQGMQTSSVYATMQENLILINRELAARSYANAMVQVERQVELAQVDSLQGQSTNNTLLASADDAAIQQELERRKQAEARRKQEELARKQAEEEKRKQEELARKQAEEEKRKQEELARKQAEEEKRKQELLARKQEQERQQQAQQRSQQTEQLVRQQVLSWAAAWSAQDVQSYVSFYTPDYRPDNGTTHNEWIKQRNYRLRSPQWIKVKLEDIQVDMVDENTVTVRFLQRYQSNTYQDAGYKQLTLVKVNGQWLIREEQAVK